MKYSFRITLMMLVALFLPSVMKSQQLVTIGSNNAESVAPFYAGYQHSYVQLKYPSYQVNRSGYICSIEFLRLDAVTCPATTFDTLRVWMGVSATNSSYGPSPNPYTIVPGWFTADSLTMVYSGNAVVVPAGTGHQVWYRIQLDTPFYYDHTQGQALVISIGKDATTTNSLLHTSYHTTFGYDHQVVRRLDGSTPVAQGYPGDIVEGSCHIRMLISDDSLNHCYPPSGFDYVSPGSNEATVFWNPEPAATYEIAYCEVGNTAFDTATAIWYATSDTFYTLSNLNVSTKYRVYLRTVGASHKSDIVSLTAQPIGVIAQLPYITDFSDTTDFDNWTIDNGPYTNKWCFGTATHYGTSDHALYVTDDLTARPYAYSGDWTSFHVASRPFHVEDSSRYNVRFVWEANGQANNDYLRAVVIPASMTLPSAGTARPAGLSHTATPSGWMAIDGGAQLNLSTTWQERTTLLELAPGDYHIVFMWYNNSNANNQPPAAIGAVEIDEARSPGIVSATFVDSALSEHSATLRVRTYGVPDSYLIVYTNDRTGATDTQLVANVDHTFVLTGLPTSSTFTGAIYTICGSDTSAVGIQIDFRTACADIADLPYIENFNYLPATTTTTSYQPIAPYPNHKMPACWTILNQSASTSTHPKAFISCYNSYSVDGSNCLNLCSSRNTSLFVVMNKCQTHLCNLAMRFSYRNINGNTSPIVLGVMTDLLDTSTFHTVAILPYTTTTSIVIHIFANDTLSADSTYHIVFKYGGPGTPTNGTYAAIDNISVYDCGTCPEADSLRVESFTHTTATISWNDNSATNPAVGWDVYYGLVGFDADSVVPLAVADTTRATITGLTPNTAYECFVVAHCADSTTAVGSLRTSFSTVHPPIDSLPYLEDFSSYATGSSASIDPRWTKKGIGSSSPYCYNLMNNRWLYFFSNSTHGNSTYAALPLFSEPINHLRVQFDTRKNTQGQSTFYLGVMCNPNDISTFDTLAFINLANYSENINEHECFLDSYTGNGQYITFLCYCPQGGSNYFYLDNVQVSLIPSCRRPSQLTVCNMTANSATLRWNAPSGNTFLVEYDTLASFATANQLLVNDTTATLTGLNGLLTYYARVRTISSAIDSSEWSFSVSFRLQYLITVLVNNPAMGSVSGGGAHNVNTTATITPLPAPGHHFAAWLDGATDNPRTQIVTSDITFTAIFAQGDSIPSHDTTFVYHYPHDTTLATHYDTIVQPFHDTIQVTCYDTIIMSYRDTIVIIRFDTVVTTLHDTTFIQPTYHNLTVQSADIWMGQGCGTGRFPEGCTVEIVGLPGQGFRFKEWDDGNTDNPRRITLDADALYTATFEAISNGVEETTEVQRLKVYPNPTTGICRLSSPDVVSTTVYNSIGQQVLVVKGNGAIDLSLQPAGTYTLRIVLPQGVVIRKVVKQ